MKFLLQTNLLNPEELKEIKSILEKYPTDYVQIIPFSESIEVPDQNGDYIPYGSTSLTNIGYAKYNWSGLHFSLATFNYEAADFNRDDMLNANSVMRLDAAIEFLSWQHKDDVWFVRPSEDLKQFTGTIVSSKEGHDWFKDMMECATSGTYKLEPYTKVVVARPINIDAEVRCFVVGGKVVSASTYRVAGELQTNRISDLNEIELYQNLADVWLPNPCCVMDIAYIGDELKVIEFNCINSSGFYSCNKKSIFDALWEYHKNEISKS